MKQSIPWLICFIVYMFLMLVAPLTQFAGWFPSLKSDHRALFAFLWMITLVFALILIVLFAFGFTLFLKRIQHPEDTIVEIKSSERAKYDHGLQDRDPLGD